MKFSCRATENKVLLTPGELKHPWKTKFSEQPTQFLAHQEHSGNKVLLSVENEVLLSMENEVLLSVENKEVLQQPTQTVEEVHDG